MLDRIFQEYGNYQVYKQDYKHIYDFHKTKNRIYHQCHKKHHLNNQKNIWKQCLNYLFLKLEIQSLSFFSQEEITISDIPLQIIIINNIGVSINTV